MLIDAVPPHLLRAGLGLILGALLGFAARRARFCTLGAIEDAVYAHDTRRARAWMLAAAVAIIGTHLLEAFAGLDLGLSVFTGPRLEWGAMLIGGAMFGLGMALVGTCAFGALLRLGGGDLRAVLVLLVLGVSSYAAIGGLTAMARALVTAPLELDLGRSQRLAALLGLPEAGRLACGIAAAFALALAALASRPFRQARRLVLGALAVGALIVAGWWASGIAGFDPFETRVIGSFSFARPIGDALIYAMIASGTHADFGIGAVVGAPLGAFAAARGRKEFRWEGPDDPREMGRHILGAALMGTGGVTALGCTIGQGLSGLSTLSVGSFLAVAAILAGARAGLYILIERRM